MYWNEWEDKVKRRPTRFWLTCCKNAKKKLLAWLLFHFLVTSCDVDFRYHYEKHGTTVAYGAKILMGKFLGCKLHWNKFSHRGFWQECSVAVFAFSVRDILSFMKCPVFQVIFNLKYLEKLLSMNAIHWSFSVPIVWYFHRLPLLAVFIQTGYDYSFPVTHNDEFMNKTRREVMNKD